MHHGTLALFVRAMRVDSRSIKIYLGFLTLMISTLVALWATLEETRLSAPGRTFFRYLLWIDFAAALVVSTNYFSLAIVEEKEEMTLGLLKMAGIGPLGLLTGKGLPRLLLVLLLLAVQFPFVTLSITMGGVALHQIVCGFVALLAFTFMGFGIGMYGSVVGKTTKVAASLTTWLILFVLCSGFFLFIATNLAMAYRFPLPDFVLRLSDFLSSISMVYRFTLITGTGYSGSPFSMQVFVHLLIGLASLITAWLLFERATKNELPVAPPRMKASMKRTSSLRPGRPWTGPFSTPDYNALAWKDFNFGAYGRAAFIGRVILYPALAIGMVMLIVILGNEPVSMKLLGTTLLMISLGGIAVEFVGTASRFINDELKFNTWQNLFLLPMSVPEIVLSKLAGNMVALIPPFAWFVVGCLLGLENTAQFFDQVSHDEEAFIVFFAMFSVFSLLSVMTFAFSIIVKRGGGALAVAVTFFLVLSSGACIGTMGGGSVGGVFFFSLMAWVVMAFLIIYALEKLQQLAQE